VLDYLVVFGPEIFCTERPLCRNKCAVDRRTNGESANHQQVSDPPAKKDSKGGMLPRDMVLVVIFRFCSSLILPITLALAALVNSDLAR